MLSLLVLVCGTQTPAPSVDICIVKTLQLLEREEEEKESEILSHLDTAISQGSATAAFLKWQSKHKKHMVSHPPTTL